MVASENDGSRDSLGRFQPGHSGNPGGRRSKRVVRAVLERAIEEVYSGVSGTHRDGPALELIVERIVRIAVLGEDRMALDAAKWITEQLDGKVPQAILSESEGGGLVIQLAEARPREES